MTTDTKILKLIARSESANLPGMMDEKVEIPAEVIAEAEEEEDADGYLGSNFTASPPVDFPANKIAPAFAGLAAGNDFPQPSNSLAVPNEKTLPLNSMSSNNPNLSVVSTGKEKPVSKF